MSLGSEREKLQSLAGDILTLECAADTIRRRWPDNGFPGTGDKASDWLELATVRHTLEELAQELRAEVKRNGG